MVSIGYLSDERHNISVMNFRAVCMGCDGDHGLGVIGFETIIEIACKKHERDGNI